MALRYLADKSALARVRHDSVAAVLGPVFADIGTCGVIDLEMLFSARSHGDLVAILRERRALPQLAITQAMLGRVDE